MSDFLAELYKDEPLAACDHLSEPLTWRLHASPVVWCSTCSGLRCRRCHLAHLVEHLEEPSCADCESPLGVEREGVMVRFPVVVSYDVTHVVVSFAGVGGVVLDFDDVRIEDAAIVCLSCAAYRGAFDALDS